MKDVVVPQVHRLLTWRQSGRCGELGIVCLMTQQSAASTHTHTHTHTHIRAHARSPTDCSGVPGTRILAKAAAGVDLVTGQEGDSRSNVVRRGGNVSILLADK
jgi:hypothetical protein